MTDGAVQFTWPAEIPSIVCAVLQVTDVALEPGEAITSVSTGDNLRWSVEAVVSGEGPAQQPHLIIKPFDRGLVTSVVVTTTRRSYHLTLRSTDHSTCTRSRLRTLESPKNRLRRRQNKSQG